MYFELSINPLIGCDQGTSHDHRENADSAQQFNKKKKVKKLKTSPFFYFCASNLHGWFVQLHWHFQWHHQKWLNQVKWCSRYSANGRWSHRLRLYDVCYQVNWRKKATNMLLQHYQMENLRIDSTRKITSLLFMFMHFSLNIEHCPPCDLGAALRKFTKV